ncbi:MAG: response regulator [Pseudomonadales bacterium]|jgi:two-component system invasion response regulator UvrY|nr:response regulator [Pseudomonadales bacterium]
MSSASIKHISILIVDDHDLVRMGLRHMLTDVENFLVIGEACSGEEALDKAAELIPDVVLMDVRMPGIGGIEATQRMERRSPDSRVVALTACADDPFPDLLLEAGARGFLTKDSGMEELVTAIREVHAGNHYVCRKIAQELALKPLRKRNGANHSPFDELSEREMQVALMIVGCQSAQDIADQLNVSPKTVNTYRYRMFEKLGVDSDVGLTLLALRHKLFVPDGDG